MLKPLRPDCWVARYNAARTPLFCLFDNVIRRALPFGRLSRAARISSTASRYFAVFRLFGTMRAWPYPARKVNNKHDPGGSIRFVLYRTFPLPCYSWRLLPFSAERVLRRFLSREALLANIASQAGITSIVVRVVVCGWMIGCMAVFWFCRFSRRRRGRPDFVTAFRAFHFAEPSGWPDSG